MIKYFLAVRVSVVSFLLLTAVPLGARPQEAKWKEYSYPQDGFSIKGPTEPQLNKQTKDGVGGSVELHFYGFSLTGDSGFMIIAAEMNPNDHRNSQQTLTDAKNGAASAV